MHRVLPRMLERRFRVFLKPGGKATTRTIRSVKAADIGHLVSFKGICTRVGDVKPLIEVACFTCDSCEYEVYQEEQEIPNKFHIWSELGWAGTRAIMDALKDAKY